MKRILFVSSFKGVGGTEISLLNLLKQLNKDQVQVDLALIGEQGPLTSKIPEWVRVISIENKSTKEYIRSMAKGGKPFKALQGIIRHFRLKSEWSRSKLDTMNDRECLAEMRKALKSHKMHCIGSPQQLLSYVYEEN